MFYLFISWKFHFLIIVKVFCYLYCLFSFFLAIFFIVTLNNCQGLFSFYLYSLFHLYFWRLFFTFINYLGFLLFVLFVLSLYFLQFLFTFFFIFNHCQGFLLSMNVICCGFYCVAFPVSVFIFVITNSVHSLPFRRLQKGITDRKLLLFSFSLFVFSFIYDSKSNYLSFVHFQFIFLSFGYVLYSPAGI